MAKSIYCTVLLLVLCIAHKAHGHERFRIVRNMSPHTVSHDENQYDLSGANVPQSDSVAELPPSSLSPHLSKLLSFNSPSINNRSSQISQFPRSPLYFRSQPSDITESGVLNEKRLKSMMSGFMNNGPLGGPYNNRNNQIDMNTEFPNTGKRQNSMTSHVQDLPNVTPTTNNPSPRRVLGSGQTNRLSSDDDSQRTNDGDDENKNEEYPSTVNRKSLFKPISFRGHNVMVMSVRQCCTFDKCVTLKDGEECNFDGLSSNTKTAQQPNDAMLMSSSTADLHGSMSNFKDSNLNKSFGQKSFSNFAGADGSDEDGNVEKAENENSTNMKRQDPMDLLTMMNPSGGFGNDIMMGSYTVMPKKRKPKTFSASNPIGIDEDEANKIRKAVLDKSNFYRKKYNLVPFTLDEQLNNCAQDWANQMAETNTDGHRPNQYYGENLYSSTDSRDLGEKAVKSWYNEILMFTVGGTEAQLSGNVRTYHMTQLLWKPSTKLGVGVSKSPSGWYNVVANYDPAGNERSFFKPNLPVITNTDKTEAKDAINAEPKPKPQYVYNSFY